jgi:hypothetical protein
VTSCSYVETGAAQPVWTRRFHWSADRDAALQQTWEALFVLLDTLLFEKQVRMAPSWRCAVHHMDNRASILTQVHIITPVLGRLDTLLAAVDAGGM